MHSQVRGGYRPPGGIAGYPLKDLYEEVAYIAYYFHWPLKEILDLDHEERRKWVSQIAEINRKLSDPQ